MLARGNSDAAVRLRRAKSITAPPRREPTVDVASSEPLSTHIDAVTAATSAFERVNGMDRTKILKRPSPQRQRTSEGSHLARQKSNISRKDSQSIVGRTRTSLDRHVQKPLAHTPGSTLPPQSKQLPAAHVNGPATAPCTTSSVARSELSSQTMSPVNQTTRHSQDIPLQTYSNTTSFGAKPSYSLDRAGPFSKRAKLAARESQTDEAILAMAREKYLQDEQTQILNRRLSSLPIRSKTRNRTPKWGSMETTTTMSTQSADSRLLPTTQDRMPQMNNAISKEKTGILRISFGSLKTRLRRTFGQSAKVETELPHQQVEARREHFGQSTITARNGQSQHILLPSTHLQGADISMNGSTRSQQTLRSLEEINNLRSRVTSWAESSGHETVVLHGATQLSAIQESPETRQSLRHSAIYGLPSNELVQHNASEVVDSHGLRSFLRRHIDASMSEDTSRDKGGVPDDAADLIPLSTGRFDGLDGTERSTTVSTQEVGPSIRPVHSNVLPGQSVDTILESTSLIFNGLARAQVTSPSIYSARPNPGSPNPELSTVSLLEPVAAEEAGTAIITESHPVSKWALEPAALKQKRSMIITSNEWRAWAADEVAEMDRPALDMAERKDKHHITNNAYGLQLQQFQIREDIGVATSTRPRPPGQLEATVGPKVGRIQSGRFPFLATSRRTSDQSTSSSRLNSSSESESKSQRESGDQRYEVQNVQSLHVEKHAKTGDLSSLAEVTEWKRVMQDGDASVTKENFLAPHWRAKPIGSNAENTAKLSPEPSLGILRDRANNNIAVTRTPISARASGSPRSPLEGTLMRRIRQGPYRPPSSSPRADMPSSAHSVNLPSSERLFGNIRGGENTPPSPSRRMVDDFLSSRSSLANPQVEKRERSSPVFL